MTASVFAETSAKMFERYEVELEFRDRLIGGQPKDPKLVWAWLRTKMGVTDPDELLTRVKLHLEEMGFDVAAATNFEEIEAAMEKAAGDLKTQGFKRDPGGHPYIESRHIKAGIKEAVNVLYAGDGWGVTGRKGPQAFTAERVFPEPDVIGVGGEDDVQVDFSVGHVTGPQGPRSTLGYYEYTVRSTVAFEIHQVLARNKKQFNEPAITYEKWAEIWSWLEYAGLGTMRSQGHGKFVVTRFELVHDPRS